jgi:hypothetical protein
MLRFQWNALRVGDEVAVHDDGNLHSPLARGTVKMVETGSGRRRESDVAIVVAGRSGVMRPRTSAVHLIDDSTADCWRCHMLLAPRRRAEDRARVHVPDDRNWDYS